MAEETTGTPTLSSLFDGKVIGAALDWLRIDCRRGRDYLQNDSGNADRLADLYSHELVYCLERQAYYVWTGQRWQFDFFLEVERRAEQTMLASFAEATHISDGDKRKILLKFINNSLSRTSLANMIHLAKKKVRQISVNDFDRDPLVLNTQNGTVDLRTGALRLHNADDVLSRMVPLRYEPGAQCPQFMNFLYRIMGSHPDASESENARAQELVAYLQKVFGCAATGRPEKVLFVFCGGGNNGKTTLVEIIRDALGDKEYAGQVQVGA